MSDEIEQFRRSLERFLQREVVPHMQEWRDGQSVPREVWRKAGEQGLLCASMPEEYGGAGGDFRYEVVIMEELARIGFLDFGIPLHNGIVAPYILHYGTEEQKMRWLPRLATGELVGAIAMTEPGTGSDLQAIRTRAVRDGDRYILDGQKTFITNGHNAGLILVVAKTGPGEGSRGLSLIGVEEDTPGFSRGRNLKKIGWHAQDTAELFFAAAEVPAENLLGREGEGFAQLRAQLPRERLIIAVEAIAAAETALDLATAYVKERKVFGAPVFNNQAVRFQLAEYRTEARIGRVFVDDCIRRLLDGTLDDTTAAMAKFWLTEKQGSIIDGCLQMFGGYGYMAEYPISHMWADARVQRIYGGTNEIMKELISRSL